jgi:hypothetical protein
VQKLHSVSEQRDSWRTAILELTEPRLCSGKSAEFFCLTGQALAPRAKAPPLKNDGRCREGFPQNTGIFCKILSDIFTIPQRSNKLTQRPLDEAVAMAKIPLPVQNSPHAWFFLHFKVSTSQRSGILIKKNEFSSASLNSSK